MWEVHPGSVQSRWQQEKRKAPIAPQCYICMLVARPWFGVDWILVPLLGRSCQTLSLPLRKSQTDRATR